MIHFFLTFSKAAADSPFGRRLVELGVAHRILAGEVTHQYHHRAWMVLVGRPKTALFAIRAALASLWPAPAPRVVVVWTHIEVLVVALLRWLLRRRDTKIVLIGFILTSRTGRLHNALRKWYFDTVFSLVDLTVVHSSTEAETYAAQFAGRRSRFVYIPWGSHIDRNGLAAAQAQADATAPADVVCAGRSGRDYPTLYQALRDSEHRVSVVCDLAEALAGCEPCNNITVLQNCYGGAYLNLVLQAGCVVIPLRVEDISAGQMVLLQAMELGKPIVITRTQTTVDYATDGHDALLVEPGNPQALRAAVDRILHDPALRQRLADNARDTFRARFTIPAYVSALVTQIQLLDPQAGRAAS